MPPSWASAIAKRDSVTVSIAADTNGIIERYAARELSTQRDFARQYVGVLRAQQDVIECETFPGYSHTASFYCAANSLGASIRTMHRILVDLARIIGLF